MKIALVRGAFLNRYEGQLYYPLLGNHKIVGFSSLHPIHHELLFPVVRLPSPMDIQFGQFRRWKMPILNRLFIDAHWLIGLERELTGFDIAHCADTFYHFTHQCINAKKQKRVKKVVATIFENIPFNNEGIRGRKEFKKDAIENIDRFVAISERSKAALVLEGAEDGKIYVLGQHIDTKRFTPCENGNSKNNLTILFVGRLEFYKGIYDVVFSAKRLLSDRELSDYDLKFLLVGDGTEKQQLIDLIHRLKVQEDVKLAEAAYNDMPGIYRKADIFVAPSRATRTYQEQFSTVLLEAQASGLPIVTTYSGGITENVENCALMANPGDFYSISEQLKKFILSGEMRRKYGSNARKHVMKFDVSEGARKLEQIYREVLAGK